VTQPRDARAHAAPALLLAGYAVAFGAAALGRGLLAFDDHPGQLYRLWHALTVGLAPWRLNPGWWAGYAELQYYPPGFSYVGAVLHYGSLGTLDLEATYRTLLWLTLLLPAATTYLLLRALLGNPWLALPGAFLALTLSGGSRSGIEEGLRWGLVAARLGWGLLPLLALSLHRWVGKQAAPAGAAPLLAAIILVHPAHAPAAVALILVAAARAAGPWIDRARRAVLILAAGTGLAAFWLVPLIAHLQMALPLAWGDASLPAVARAIAGRPLLLLLCLANSVGCWALWRRRLASAEFWLAEGSPAVAAIVAVDALLARPLGIMWLPADRLVDGLLLALIVGASLALASMAHRWPRLPAVGLAAAAIAACALLSGPRDEEPTLSLWPRSWPNEWPTYDAISRGVALPELWTALRAAPPGRILFVRSGVALEYRPDWRRPHSHVTALAPLRAGHQILGGTFTHPSPIAGLVYTGSPANQPLNLLAEQRDGITLFGQPLTELAPKRFNELADRLRVSAVVASDEDVGRLDFMSDNPEFAGPSQIGPFLLFTAARPRALPEAEGGQRWRVALSSTAGGWTSTGMAFSPLWRAAVGGAALPVRRSDLGLLEVNISPGQTAVDLEHRAGAAEWLGVGASGAALLALLSTALRRRRRPVSPASGSAPSATRQTRGS
jgi:hypothetical protein